MSPPAGAWGTSSEGPSPRSAPSTTRRPGRRPPERRPGGDGRRPAPPPSRFRPFRLARAWGAGACLLAAVVALLLGAGTAQAQTSEKLVGNTGITTGIISGTFERDHAQAFTTGNNLAGYKLTRVDLRIRDDRGLNPTPTFYTAHIARDLSDNPGTSLGELTKPASLPTTADLAQFTHATGIDLAPNTKYWAVLGISGGPSADIKVFQTWVDDEDPGAAEEWSIANGSRSRAWNAATWTTSAGNSKILAVHGYAEPARPPAPLSGRTLTISLPRAINDRECPFPDAFSLLVDGVEQPGAFAYVGCSPRSLDLRLSPRIATVDGQGNPRSGVRRPIPEGKTVTLRYDNEYRFGKKLTHAVEGSKLPSFTLAVDNQTPGPAEGPDYAGASVSGRTLELAFDGPLDGDSEPAGGAFRVTTSHGGGHGLPRCSGGCRIAVSDVSISGDTATLTLAQAIPGHAWGASVVYEAPSESPLQGASDSPNSGKVESFAEWRVSVLTPDTAPVFSSASVRKGVHLRFHTNELLDESSAPAGSAFTVTAKRDGRTRTIKGTGTARIGSSTYVKLASAVAAGEKLTLSYDKPSADPLRDRGGTEVESFSGMPVTNGQPRIQSVEIVSVPTGGDGDTYGGGDTVRVQVTFDVPVRVKTRGGVPRLKLDLVPGRKRDRYDEKWAVYESGSDTDTLTFAWTVTPIVSEAGIAVPANAIDLNGGKIIAFSSYGLPAVTADLSHAGLERDAGHKVNSLLTTPPAAKPTGPQQTIWSATLTAKAVFAQRGCWDTSSAPVAAHCSSNLTDNSFTRGGVSYQVIRVTVGPDVHLTEYLRIQLDKAIPSDLTLHVGNLEFPVADATLGQNGMRADWVNPGFSWTTNQEVSLSLAAPFVDTPPTFQSASVNGAALTLTFDEDLDAGSVPAPSDFYVTVAGERRNVASGGVAIDGGAVTLTLESAVTHVEAVKLRYTKGANPLRDAAGKEVAGFPFTEQTVANLTPPPGGIHWSATLTAKAVFAQLGCWDTSSAPVAAHCSSNLTDNSFTRGGVSYQVIRVTVGPDVHLTEYLRIQLDKAIPSDLTLHVGNLEFPVADATLGQNGMRADWVNPGFSWTTNQEVSLSLTVPTAGPSGASANSADEGPAFQSASVSGNELTVTFDEALDEDSAPPGSSFTVTATPSGGSDRTLTGTGTASVSGATVTVTLDGSVSSGETLTVSYAAPDGNPLRNAAGIDVAGFSGQSASNVPLQSQSQSSEPPGAPTGVTVAGASATSLSVSWTAPSVRGTAAIAGYELRWYAGASDPSDASAWTETGDVGAGTTATIPGLTADTAYRVQVRARGDGKGPWSASGAGRTEADNVIGFSGNDRPPKPRSATVDGRAVTVTFDRPLAAVGEGAGLHFFLTVTGAGVEQHPVRASASGRKVTATLGAGSPARAGKSYTIGYFGGGPLKGVKGNAVVRFSGLAAENLTLPVLSVADAKATEGTDTTLDFVVRMDEAMPETVTVDYATADGSATAGEDYTATSGTLTFAAGERRKTVSVPILDDAVDEGKETFLLRLSNAQGARIGDGEATGTIENDDPLQKMWLSRFGRTVATHLTDAVSDRLANPLTGAKVTVGGQSVDLARTEDEAWLGEALTSIARALGATEDPGPDPGSWSPGSGPGQAGAGGWPGTGLGRVQTALPDSTPQREITGRELLLGSAFHLAREGDGRGPGLAAWGRVTVGGFDGREAAETGDVRIDGEVTTGILGADAEWRRLLAGVAVSVSEGEGTFAQRGVDSGTIESSLTTVSPYARFMVNDRVSAWGLLGYGTGDMTITQAANDRGQPERVTRTDIEMRLGALGGRGALMQADETGGMDLALRADAFYVETEAEPVSNEGSTTAVASRVRLALEGSRAFEIGESGVLTPGLELGLRHDGGDAETGTGVELGGRVSYSDTGSGLSMEARVRGLIAHEDSDYKEWGASGSVRLDPGDRGRGLSFTLAPAYGAASSGVDRLWSARDARGLAPGGEFEPESRLEGELGYGLGLFGDRFTGTPNVGFGFSDTAREYRIGWRLTSVVRGDPGFEVNLDATRMEPVNDNAVIAGPEHGVMLRGAIRW